MPLFPEGGDGGSGGAANREYCLPDIRFLQNHLMVVLPPEAVRIPGNRERAQRNLQQNFQTSGYSARSYKRNAMHVDYVCSPRA